MKPVKVSDVDLAFGGSMKALMPPMHSVPNEFKTFRGNKWCSLVSKWFFDGLPKGTTFKPKEGVSADDALRHIKAIMASFEPKHEHKEAACAYLLSLWFDDCSAFDEAHNQ